MAPRVFKAMRLAVFLAAWAAGLVLLFERVHAPEVLLGRARRCPERIDDADLETLRRAALADRYCASEALEAAGFLAGRGRERDAAQVFEHLVSTRDETPFAALRQADALSAERDFAEAQARLLAAWQSLPHQILAATTPEARVVEGFILLRLARNAVGAGWQEKAAHYYEACLAKSPDSVTARREYAALLLAAGKVRPALNEYAKLAGRDPDAQKWLVPVVETAISAGEYPAAEAILRGAEEARSSFELRRTLAIVLSRQGRTSESLALYDDLVRERPNDRTLRVERARGLFDAKRYEEFLDASRDLAEADPTGIALRMLRARAALSVGDCRQAVAECDAALKASANHREAAVLRAICLLRDGDHASAREALEALHRNLPDDAEVRGLLAQACLLDRRYDAAVGHFRALGHKALHDAEVLQGYAQALVAAKTASREDAAALETLAPSLVPDRLRDWPAARLACVGRALAMVGDKPKAAALLEAAVAKLPQDRKLRLELADLLQELGRYDEAAKHYRVLTATTAP